MRAVGRLICRTGSPPAGSARKSAAGATAAANFFPGKLDDLRIYDRALSAAEILAIYQAGAGDPTLPVVAINSPASGATVKGTIGVLVSASDDEAVSLR